jgi:hypothetical protein
MGILDKHDKDNFGSLKVGKYQGKDVWEIAVEFKSSTYREHIFLEPDELIPGEEAEYGKYDSSEDSFELEFEVDDEVYSRVEEILEELEDEEELLTS